MDGFVTSSEAGALGGVTVLRTAEHLEQAKAILGGYFTDSVEDINKTLVVCEPREGAPVVLGCVSPEDGAVQCAGVLLESRLPKYGLYVVEIIWFGSLAKGNGWGSRLFAGLVRAALGVGADAILSTSTNAALRFWLSRREIRIADTVLRASKRAAIDMPHGFRTQPAPNSAVMERLYSEMVVRNRKGRVVGEFQGKPYHYCVEHSNHVWYVLNPRIPLRCKVNKAPREGRLAASPAPSPSPPLPSAP